MAEHDVTITLAGPGYQARCSCGWRGVIRASDHAIRKAKQECDDHLGVLAASKQEGPDDA